MTLDRGDRNSIVSNSHKTNASNVEINLPLIGGSKSKTPTGSKGNTNPTFKRQRTTSKVPGVKEANQDEEDEDLMISRRK